MARPGAFFLDRDNYRRVFSPVQWFILEFDRRASLGNRLRRSVSLCESGQVGADQAEDKKKAQGMESKL